MIFWRSDSQIYLATAPVDFRKSIDGLSMIVVNDYACNPSDGNVYVFYNKSKNKLKLIYYDGNGFMLCYKRLEQGRLIMKLKGDNTHYQMDEQQLRWLLSGLDFMILRTLPNHYNNYN